MSSSFAFNNLFKRFASDCYVIETDLSTECVNKSESCTICGGTGNVIKKAYKTKTILDIVQEPRSLLNSVNVIPTGKYYKDGRIAYFLKDSNFNLSPNVNRVVLNIVNGDIDSIFEVKYLEPLIERNQIIYYIASVTRANLNSSKALDTYRNIIKERRL